MSSLVILAAAIPFIIVVLLVVVLATVNYAITRTHVVVSILGLTIRRIPISDIASVEYVPPVPGKGISLLHHGGAVSINLAEGKCVVITPRDAEEFARDLNGVLDSDRGKRSS